MKYSTFQFLAFWVFFKLSLDKVILTNGAILYPNFQYIKFKYWGVSYLPYKLPLEEGLFHTKIDMSINCLISAFLHWLCKYSKVTRLDSQVQISGV